MALDLFVNFERSSNSSLFYRVTSSSPSTFTIKLSDLLLPDQHLSTTYYVESAVNSGSFSKFNPTNGLFISEVTFDTQSPCVCSINLNVSAAGSFKAFALSGVFVQSFPAVDFIAYPANYIDEELKQTIALDDSSYMFSPGVYFYGEGHTETINLSAKGLDAGVNTNWFIGNTIEKISNNSSVLSAKSVSQSTFQVSVTSAPADESTYPISLWATNTKITTSGPFIKYNDSGTKEFYPFFSSTLDVNGIENRQILKGNIKVLPYTNIVSPTFHSPFASSYFTLPLDYGLQTFRGSFVDNSSYGILSESFVGSQWELQTTYNIQDDVREKSTETPLLSTILAYQFQLGYDQPPEDLVFPYYVSPSVPSTVSLMTSAFKDVCINFAPHDWIPRRIIFPFSSTTTIGPLPFVKLYIPNYFNLKNQDVSITVVAVPDPPLLLQSLTIQSNHSSDVLVLSGTQISGTMQFDKIGLVDLSATAILTDTLSGTTRVTNLFTNMAEIVNSYEDESDEHYYQTAITPFELTYSSQPRLTPNEWAIADNVNSIIEKIYTTLEELNGYTKLYEKKDKFYGWLGPKQLSTTTNSIQNSNAPIWMEAECGAINVSTSTWASLEGDPSQLPLTWLNHECVNAQSDPSCLQKYCLEWKWKSRKAGATDVSVTWSSAKQNASYAKKWSFEKCANDSETLNCDRDSWKISTIDASSFPIPSSSCSPVSRCSIVDVEVSSESNQLVVAFPTEINLVDKDYFSTYVARQGMADGLFAFQNIVGLTINTEGKVIVLDKTLLRISVFKIVDDSFVLFTTWGQYGTVATPLGFNEPTDVHVDSTNSVWIADMGNNCVKKFTVNGKHLLTITHDKLTANAPISICVDSKLNIHCLTNNGVIVFDQKGNYSFEYSFPDDVVGVKKINTSYNREAVYITYSAGVIKYFRTGAIFDYMVQDLQCTDKQVINGYNSLSQDHFRNVYVTVGDKILKIPDLQKIVETKAALPKLYWKLEDLLIHKEEYIQPWVYLKSFHRLWDNIELFRNSLFYDLVGCKSYTTPDFTKTDLVIGQNEIVSNAVINRLSEQLWTNLSSLFDYFDPNC